MRSTVLVVTTVHWPDDTRIRDRLIRTLATRYDVVYAARHPGPTDTDGLTFVELRGGRWRRNLAAIGLCLRTRWDILVVHDPELVLCALLAKLMRRRPVVFDVHEDVPATAHTRSWVPGPLRGLLAAAMRLVLRVAESALSITLAEADYQRLFHDPHPVFANHPDTTRYPEPGVDPSGPAIYVGDVTLERGSEVAVRACADAGIPLRLIGRVHPDLQARLTELGSGLATLEGLKPNREALLEMAGGSVGLSPLLDLPNYRLSQPTKVLEYLAMGLPVVASDLPGTREMVDGLEGVFLVEPGEPADLAAAIAMARSPEVAEVTLRQAALVRERFRWPSESVLEFYESLL